MIQRFMAHFSLGFQLNLVVILNVKMKTRPNNLFLLSYVFQNIKTNTKADEGKYKKKGETYVFSGGSIYLHVLIYSILCHCSV